MMGAEQGGTAAGNERTRNMKLISWNVNGLRACVGKGFLDAFAEFGAGMRSLEKVPSSMPHVFSQPAKSISVLSTPRHSRRTVAMSPLRYSVPSCFSPLSSRSFRWAQDMPATALASRATRFMLSRK